jgi:hypothetical protein
MKDAYWAGGVVQAVESLLSNLKALSSNTIQNKKEKPLSIIFVYHSV